MTLATDAAPVGLKANFLGKKREATESTEGLSNESVGLGYSTLRLSAVSKG
jgi:hypothetical protein